MNEFDIYDELLLKHFLEDDVKSVQVHYFFEKDLFISFDNLVEKINSKTKRKSKYSRTELLRLAIKLYVYVYKQKKGRA